MTAGERRLAQRLQEKLENDYLCWYDVPVGRAWAHPDFIVLHPRRGLLVLEVKDWKLDTVRDANKNSLTHKHFKGACGKCLPSAFHVFCLFLKSIECAGISFRRYR